MKIWVPVVKFKPIELGRQSQPYHLNPPTEEIPKKPKKLIRRVGVVAALLVIASIGVMAILVKALGSPSQGTVDNSGIAEKPHTAAQTTSHYDGSYFSFNYPGNFKIVPAEKSTNYIDSIAMLSDDHPSIHVAFSLVSGQLSGDSGVNFRQLHPELYKTISSTDTTKVYSRDNDGGEYTGYIAQNGKVLSVSLVSVSPTKISDDYNFIANSLSWKQ